MAHQIVIRPGQAITYRAPCPGCGAEAEWEHQRAAMAHDEWDRDTTGPDTYVIRCPCP
ncbi:hypothetical protein CLV30_12568 [Haloactinopolyspora alba]|uniref:Uncharacterized protein n=1 Tax=Haloactinopolyspora alba TaxID=648780 RepID=A0A2P8DHJ4_9ACTN|nr:hypothetical protein CLV30_12568 [Haloactinopolyspora alba]